MNRRSAATLTAMPELVLECTARSDIGHRPNNEDAVFGSPRVAAVADGVGGAAGGEVASSLAVMAMVSLDNRRLERSLEDELLDAVREGNDSVAFVSACRPELAGMATTLTAVVLDSDGCYVIAHVGDSRAYLLRQGELRQLTRDASLVQELVDQGAITEEEARSHPQRSVVLDAIDGRPARRVPLERVEAHAGDRLLLCSDGLSDVVADEAIAATLAGGDRERCAEALVQAALVAGGRDNVSVLVADVVAAGAGGTAWP